MEDFDLNIVAKKSIKGIFALTTRTFLVQILGIVTSFILTVFLDPASFGVFFIASSIIVFLNYFQDIGLAASLIQKKEEPTREELRTTFTVQQILVLLLCIPSLIFAKNITSYYGLNIQGYYLFIVLIISFFLSSLRTIPTVILERKLDFDKLVIPQIVENIVYNLILIIFVISGLGITSFTIAILARSIIGLILIYIVQPWEVGFSFKISVLKKLISFGLPFQANSILALIKDDLLNIYIGKILPLNQVGYVGFSQKWAFMPLRLVMDNVVKIAFPSMSRLQHDKNALKLAIEKSLFLVSFLIFPAAIGIIMLSPYFIQLVPRYQKWELAILSLSFFSLNTIFSSISTPLTNFLNAIGKIKITFYFMIVWTILTWILTPLMINKFGFNGVGISSFLISTTSFFVFIIARRYIEFSFVKPVIRQFLVAILMMIFIFLTKNIINSLPLLFFEIIIAGLFYLGVLFLIARAEIIKTIRFIIENVRSK